MIKTYYYCYHCGSHGEAELELSKNGVYECPSCEEEMYVLLPYWYL